MFFYPKYFHKNVLAFSSLVITSISPDQAESDLGEISRVKYPEYLSSLSLIRRLSSGIFPSHGKSPLISSVLSERYTKFIVDPRRTNVFIRSTPLDGSTLAIERAVCSVIFLIVSGRASPYSEMIKSQVFGGALIILIVIFGYFVVMIFR